MRDTRGRIGGYTLLTLAAPASGVHVTATKPYLPLTLPILGIEYATHIEPLLASAGADGCAIAALQARARVSKCPSPSRLRARLLHAAIAAGERRRQRSALPPRSASGRVAVDYYFSALRHFRCFESFL